MGFEGLFITEEQLEWGNLAGNLIARNDGEGQTGDGKMSRHLSITADPGHHVTHVS